MKFVKMHGCGNDYVYVDGFRERVRNPAAASRAISDRHFGVGADGLILILPSRAADFRMRMFNADGSEGRMCGNGLRCIGKFVYENGLTRRRELTVETPGGVVDLRLRTRNGRVDRVTVDMGPPRRIERVPVSGFDGWIVDMGNPHFVTFVRDTRRVPIESWGPTLEHHPRFPHRTNVEFVQVVSSRRLRQRTWERGSGETLACGSGACAAAAAADAATLAGRRVRVDLRGGSLDIEADAAGHLWMTGPAVEVFRGEWPNR